MLARTLLAAATLCTLAAAPALAQRAKATTAPGEVTIVNARSVAITGFAMTDDAGKVVGKIGKAVPAGKSVKIKVARGAPCTLNVAANFDDASDGSEGQLDVCADKTIRFTD